MEDQQKLDTTEDQAAQPAASTPTAGVPPSTGVSPPRRSNAAVPLACLLLASGALSFCLGGMALLAFLQIAAGAALLGLWFKGHPLATRLDPAWSHKHGKKGFIGAVALFALLTLALGGGIIEDVKGAQLPMAEDVRYGKVFDNYKYFSKVEWSLIKTDNGRRIVQAVCQYDLSEQSQRETVTATGLYTIRKDSKFNITSLKELELIWQFVWDDEAQEAEIIYAGGRVTGADGSEWTKNIDDFLTELFGMADNEPSPTAGAIMAHMIELERFNSRARD